MASTLAAKLKIKPGTRVLALNAPEGYRAALEPLPDGAGVAVAGSGPYDVVQLFVRDLATLLSTLAGIRARVAEGGVLWVCYPKLTSKLAGDLSRDRIFESVQTLGMIPVTQIAIHGDRSALWLRPIESVGRKR